MRLYDLADKIKSKNAGPFHVTFDIVFDDRQMYEAVKKTGSLNRKMFAELYQTPLKQVQFYECDASHAFKFTIPRRIVSGDLDDPDVYGAQQFYPLWDVEIPLDYTRKTFDK